MTLGLPLNRQCTISTSAQKIPTRCAPPRCLPFDLPDPEFYRPVDAVRHAKPITESATENGRWATAGNRVVSVRPVAGRCRLTEKVYRAHSGSDAFDRLFLAKAHWQLGEKDDAMKRYREALEYINSRKMVLSRRLHRLTCRGFIMRSSFSWESPIRQVQ